MGFVQRLTHDLKAGLARLRYGTVYAAHRALEETELLQLLLELRKLDARIDDLCGEIGERAIDLYERGTATEQILLDPDIVRGIEQVVSLRADRLKVTSDMDEVRSDEGHIRQ